MTGYLIADITVTSPRGMEEYGELAYPTLVAAGGKMLAVSSRPEIIEGDWQPGIVVLIEFPTVEELKKWLDSPEYQPARDVRHRSAYTCRVTTTTRDKNGKEAVGHFWNTRLFVPLG